MIRARIAALLVRLTGINPDMLMVGCMWCSHDDDHDDDTGCPHAGCSCTDLM